jgi:hypothetical protein
MIYIENKEDAQIIYIPRTAVETRSLSPIPDELMGDYYTKQQVDNKVIDLQGQINTTNVEVQELDERVTAIENNGTGGGGGSIDNEEIERIKQSIDALDERLTYIDLIQSEQATAGNKIKVSTIKRIAEWGQYSTDFVIKGITINGVLNNNVRIISSRVTKNPFLPASNSWMIWGLFFDGSLYVVSWTADGSMTDTADVQASITKLF